MDRAQRRPPPHVHRGDRRADIEANKVNILTPLPMPVLAVDADGRFRVVEKRFLPAITDLLRDYLMLQARGDYAGKAAFLELVRLGVKPADDPVVRNSLAVVDEQLGVDTPSGTFWHRYTEDGYGETLDGGKRRYGKIFLLMDADADGHHRGGAGNDHLYTTSDKTGRFFGFDGNDTLIGSLGHDVVDSGRGNDPMGAPRA